MNASVESLAAVKPSAITVAPRDRERGPCPCCNSTRDLGSTIHPILGRVCVWCARALDYRLDAHGLEVRPPDVCGACLELGRPCDQHEAEGWD